MKKRRKKVRLRKVFIILAIGLTIPLAFSSFKNKTFALPSMSEKEIDTYKKEQTNIIEEREIDSKYINIVSKDNTRYISKLFNINDGKEVSITSIIKPEKIDLFYDKVKELIYLKYPKFISNVISKLDKTNAYFIKDNELIIYFYDYEITPEVNSELLIHINFNEIKEYLDITVKLDKEYENEDGTKIDLNKKQIAITFDDGPSIYTSHLIDVLRDNLATSTFFMLGKNISIYKDAVKKAYDNNMEIGYHSYNHQNFKRQSLSTIIAEFNKSNETLKSITNTTFKLIRPPYGNITTNIKENLNATFILWSVDTEDWRHKDIEYLKNYVLDNAKDGSIILFHDIHKTSVEAIENLLPYLYINNYQLVTVSKLASITNTDLELHKSYRFFTK